jgi:general secretion pathway protein G
MYSCIPAKSPFSHSPTLFFLRALWVGVILGLRGAWGSVMMLPSRREKFLENEVSMKRKKRPFTLLEIMIVIFLIAIIGSVIGFNMKGSLDEGRRFKTEQAMERIRELLLLEVAKGTSLDDVINGAENYLKNAGIVKDPKKMLQDGWGEPFTITKTAGGDIRVVSEKLKAFKKKKSSDLGKAEKEEEEAL